MAKPKQDKKEKKDKKGKDEQADVVQEESAPQTPPEPKFLSDRDAIYFWKTIADAGSDLDVPPSTPRDIANLVVLPKPFPATFPTFEDFTVPYVREVGVKKSMEEMGKYLNCTNYAFDYLQFWFVDILVDCLWKTQDQYYLGEEEQKMVLRWVVHVFTMMTDTKVCFTRKEFFKLFKEMIFMAADYLNEGNAKIPPPEEICVLIPKETQNDDDKSMGDEQSRCSESLKSPSTPPGSRSISTLSLSSCKSEEIIEMEMGDQKRTFTIRRKKCFCHLEEACGDKFDLPTSVTTTLSSSKQSSNIFEKSTLQLDAVNEEKMTEKTGENGSSEIVEEAEIFPNKYYKIFHQPDTDIPKRFMPLSSSSGERSISIDGFLYSIRTDEGGEYEGLEMDVDADYINLQSEKDDPASEDGGELSVKHDFSIKASRLQMRKDQSSEQPPPFKPIASKKSLLSQPKSIKAASTTFTKGPSAVKVPSTVTTELSNEDITDEMIIERLQKFKLWEKRMQDLADPKVGWPAVEEDEEEIDPAPQSPNVIDVDNEDWEELVNPKDITKQDKDLYIGLGVLCAIVDFVLDYFYRDFHYTLIRLATKSIPSIVTQTLNTQWKVPKAIKDEFHRPKQEKPKKEKKAKKGKKDKKSKKSKSSSKSSKKGGKKDKKGKKSSKSSSKGSKKSKKEKAPKLTKEQKAELERQRKLQEEYEAEQRRLQENLRFMFPLADAVDDQLFMDIFEDWQKPKEKGSKKDKKDKKKGKKK